MPLKPGSRRFRFTQREVEALPPNRKDASATEMEYSDIEVRGFRVLVSKNGRKTYYLRYTLDGRKRVYRIGEHGPFSTADARKEALRLRALIEHGHDPQLEREQRRAIPTFAEFARDEYMPHARNHKKSWKTDEGKLENNLIPRWGRFRLTEISTRDVESLMSDLSRSSAKATANRYYALVHRMFHLAIIWGRLEKNPAQGVQKFRENNKRDRYLTGDELRRFLKALDEETNPIVAGLFRFLLLNGVRLGEALDAKWQDVDLEERKWFLPQTKAGKGRWVVLNEHAAAVLTKLPRTVGTELIFPGAKGGRFSKPQGDFHRVLKRAGIENFRIHDLRHTFASQAINQGATLYEVQHLLGHLCSTTTTRYAHLADDRLRAVSSKVGDEMNGTPAESSGAG